MIRRAHDRHTEMSASDPTPEEIRQRSEQIRQAWNPRERARRSGMKNVGWSPPVLSELDFPGYANDFDS